MPGPLNRASVPSRVVQSLPSSFSFPHVSSPRSTSSNSRFLKAPWTTSSRPPSSPQPRALNLWDEDDSSQRSAQATPTCASRSPSWDRDPSRFLVPELTARSLPDLALTDSRRLYFQSNWISSLKSPNKSPPRGLCLIQMAGIITSTIRDLRTG